MKASDLNNELHELDRFFAETLNEASVKPSEDVWKDLEIKLDDKPRRRLFPWLMLPLGLIVCSLLGYFFISPGSFQKPSTGHSTSVNNRRAPAKGKGSSAVIPPGASVPVIKSAPAAADPNTRAGENNASGISSKKIQLAALKNHNARFPRNIAGFEVKAETAGNGLKKYYIEVRDHERGSVESALNDVRTAGYKDAFLVKQNSVEAGSSILLANRDERHEPSGTGGKTLSNPQAQKITGPLAMNSKSHTTDRKANSKEPPASSDAGILKSAPVYTDPSRENTVSAALHEQKETGSKTSKTSTNSGNERNPDLAKQSATGNDGVAASSDKGSQGLSTEPASASFSSSVTTEKNVVQNATTQVMQNTVTTAPPEPKYTDTGKTDSLAKGKHEGAKTDSGAVSPVVKTPESGISDPPFKRFGLYLLAGPEYIKPLAGSFNEKTSPSFNGGVKLQYFIGRHFALELGASYQTSHSSSGDDTLAFAKNISSDTYIHSTYGDMTIDPATLTDGFSPLAPVNNFKVKYSYQLHYSVLNIPLNLKFYPVKRDKLSVSVTAGINSQKIISQSAQLVLYKENFNNVLNYNNLLSGKFSFSLLLGLGCELKLYKGLYVVAEPNLRYGLTNMNTTYGISGNRSKFLYFDGNAGFKIIF